MSHNIHIFEAKWSKISDQSEDFSTATYEYMRRFDASFIFDAAVYTFGPSTTGADVQLFIK